MTGPSINLDWTADGVPVSRQFDDPFFSLEDGLGETRHVFLAGNELPERFRPGFRIAELGFGTGLNMLATLLAWRGSGQTGPLAYTSFEAYPLQADEIEIALSVFPEIRAIAGPFLAQWSAGGRVIEMEGLRAEIIFGDARGTLPHWSGTADAWFLDGFAPARNAELWEPRLLGEVARHTAPQGTCATYTAAGMVRRGLQQVGFDVRRVPGYGRKRHMLLGRMP